MCLHSGPPPHIRRRTPTHACARPRVWLTPWHEPDLVTTAPPRRRVARCLVVGDGGRRSMLRNVLTDYTRMGRSQLELPIYDCECWAVGKPHMNAPQVIIPFCARVTVGIDANVAAFKVRLRERGARFCRGAVLAVGVKS